MANSNDSNDRTKVLLTGAGGKIGTAFREYVGQQGDPYEMRFTVYPATGEEVAEPGTHEVRALDVADLEGCRSACTGMDVVVHLAAVTSGRVGFYDGLLDANIKGVYNILLAAQEAGCRRAIVMSSVQAIEGYPLDVQPRTGDAPRPLNMYAATKAFAEAACHVFASQGMSCIAVRVGSFESPWVQRDPNARNLSTFVSQRDMSELLVRCIEAPPEVGFAVVHGLSDNRYKRMDLSDTRALLGYAPRDDSFERFNVGLIYTERWKRNSGRG